MNNKTGWVVILGLGFASVSHAGPSLTAQGPCDGLAEGKEHSLTLTNAELKVVVEIKETPFEVQKEPGHTALWVVPKLTNLSRKPMSVTLSTAFFDKTGTMVVAFAQDWHRLEVGEKDFPLGSGFQRLPEADLKRVTSCTITILTGTPHKPTFTLDTDGEADPQENVIPQARPFVRWLQAVKDSDIELLKSIWPKSKAEAVPKEKAEQHWREKLELYRDLWKQEFGDYQLGDFKYRYEGDEKRGRLHVSHKGKALAPLMVIQEANDWRVNED